VTVRLGKQGLSARTKLGYYGPAGS